MNDTGDSLQTKDGIDTNTNKETINKEVKETEKEIEEIKDKEVEGKEKEGKEKEGKSRSVSFNRDVHVKRFGKPRETRGEQTPTRKEPFTHLSEEELINEANKVIAQAQSVTCTADHPPDKFFSLPHRKKLKEDRGRRNSDDNTDGKSSLGRSTSDVGKKRKERTSLSTLFRRQQRNKSPVEPVVVTTKPVIVKRSKSDVTDLKSNTKLNTQTKPIRKRSGSETEEFLKSLRNKKSQLSPIIESSPRDDYFKKTPPLELFQKQKLAQKESIKSDKSDKGDKKVNPVEKPPRFKTPEKSEPKPPTRTKRGKSIEKEQSPPIGETPKRKTEVKKTLLVDEIDSLKPRDINPVELKDKIKESIRKIEENVYADKEMIHSSQQPPDKPPLTRGHTVDHMVRILREDQMSPPPKSHLISQLNGSSVNQPFSYIKPSVSPDGNLFVRNSPDRIISPVNKMTDRGVVYAQVIRDGERNSYKDSLSKKYSSSRDKIGNHSDEDEGLGYEERYRYSKNYNYEYNHKTDDKSIPQGFKITDSPIKPKFREFRMTSFDDFEPTYANDYPSHKDDSHDFIETFRGRGDGMDTNKKVFEPESAKVDLDFNELSHRRQLLESRLNARRHERERVIERVDEPITRYLMETDPIYEAEKKMKATERYVNETARYYRHTLERDGFAESSVNEDYSKYDSDKQNIKYNTESRAFSKGPKDEVDRREYTGRIEPRFKDNRKVIPPEPEYEPPSLESNAAKPVLSPNEYKDKKYRSKKLTSSHDALQTGQKYKVRDEYFGKRKGHYASNPEIAQEREEEYANLPKYTESYHNSLRRVKNKDRYKEDFTIRRHDSGDSRDYYDRSPSRFDNRLVDSGIENDFRKDSDELHRRHRRYESDDDVHKTTSFLDSERQHTENNYPGEQIYANTEYLKYKGYKEQGSRERSVDGSKFDSKERFEKSSSYDDKLSSKPPKAKKLSGLEKMKQLFSRDSSKKSKKEKEVVPQHRTRVLTSPEHLVRRDSEYRRYTDPEPSEIMIKKINYECSGDERRSREHRREASDLEPSSYRHDRYERKATEERYQNHRDVAQRQSSERDSDRPSDGESELRKNRSRTAGPMDSPALAERYRGRRRLATPSPTPTPSPQRRQAPAPAPAAGWFKSLDRLTRKKGKTSAKVEKESIITEDESRKAWSKKSAPLNSPAKNLRFFGDTDPDSDANASTKPRPKTHGTLRKTISNSTNGNDEVDHIPNKSYSLTNLHKEEKRESIPKYKRNLQNISEQKEVERRMASKPPIPYDRSRSQSSSKTLKGERDMRRDGSSSELRKREDRGSSSELKSKPEVNRDLKQRRRPPAAHSGESSTEGDSSHHSQRSVVYLHATTVGDIPDPGRITRNRSRDDVSSVNSSNLQVRSTTKSFSIFAPWTPKHYGDQQDVHYAQRPRKSKKELVKKASSTKTLNERPSLQKNKSYSQTTLTKRPSSSRLTSSSQTLYRKPERRKERETQSTLRRPTGKDAKKTQSSEIITRDNDRERVSRSISMPKDNNKKAGWFKLSNKNKKPEVNSRVR